MDGMEATCRRALRITPLLVIARPPPSSDGTDPWIGFAGRVSIPMPASLPFSAYRARAVANSTFGSGGRGTQRRYRGDTLILETRFETTDGAVLLIDFMPPRSGHSNLVRIVVGKRGHVPMRTELAVRFGYGATVPWVHRQEDGTLRAIAGPDQVVLRTPISLHGKDLTTVGEFSVPEGDVIPFTLTYAPSHLPPPDPVAPQAALDATEQFWREWSGRARLEAGGWRDAVMRSLITLKALTYAPTGGIVAAPTTSLPETLGGIRNWDYRFCWLRDATLSLLALMNAGYYEEAGSWRDWLLRAVAGVPAQAQIMYSITGKRRLTEWEVSWLPGYEGAKPVRIGNGAHGQIQIDIYGEVMDALYQAQRGGLAVTSTLGLCSKPSYPTWLPCGASRIAGYGRAAVRRGTLRSAK